MTSLYNGGNHKDASHSVRSDEIYTLWVQIMLIIDI